jgi:flavin-dependent dehydrogenase
MSIETDIAVVGAGPAGLATAISARRRGCRVTLLERTRFPRYRPGESQHPGVGVLVKELGIEDLAQFSPIRHSGIWVNWQDTAKFFAFGEDGFGPWRGYQITRSILDQVLLARAKQLGVRILQPCGETKIFRNNGRVLGVHCEHGQIKARFTIDASGSQHWLRRELNLPLLKLSPRLVACYGYVHTPECKRFANPSITADGATWTWIAQIEADVCHWTRLNLNSGFSREVPLELQPSVMSCSKPFGADVTWRTVQPTAGPGFFLVGDAAAVLDPVASHGMLRSLMSGMMVGHLIACVIHGLEKEKSVISFYKGWLADWVRHDIVAVTDLYRRLEAVPEWLTP